MKLKCPQCINEVMHADSIMIQNLNYIRYCMAIDEYSIIIIDTACLT